MHHVLGITERLRDRETRLLDERSAVLESAERLAFLIRMVGLPVGLLLWACWWRCSPGGWSGGSGR